MDTLRHLENISTCLWGCSSSTSANSSSSNQDQTESSESCNKDDIPVTRPSQERNSPAQSTVISHSDPTQIALQYQSSFDETAEVDKINLIVKCAGKTMEVDMFPQERISTLLKEACERAGRKPEKMTLVFEGNPLDVNQTVSHYGLRGGRTVHLIGKA